LWRRGGPVVKTGRKLAVVQERRYKCLKESGGEGEATSHKDKGLVSIEKALEEPLKGR